MVGKVAWASSVGGGDADDKLLMATSLLRSTLQREPAGSFCACRGGGLDGSAIRLALHSWPGLWSVLVRVAEVVCWTVYEVVFNPGPRGVMKLPRLHTLLAAAIRHQVISLAKVGDGVADATYEEVQAFEEVAWKVNRPEQWDSFRAHRPYSLKGYHSRAPDVGAPAPDGVVHSLSSGAEMRLLSTARALDDSERSQREVAARGARRTNSPPHKRRARANRPCHVILGACRRRQQQPRRPLLRLAQLPRLARLCRR